MLVMSIFNLFKSKKKENNKTLNTKRNTASNRKLADIMTQIEENKYVNDDRVKQLYSEAYDQTQNDLIGRHFYYNNVIDYYYGLRNKEKDALEKCIEYCKEDIKITPQVLNIMKKDDTFKHFNENNELVFTPPRFPSFQRLSIIYENAGKYEEGIKVCEKAIENSLKDGTKTGFERRIKRLEKKMNK